MEIASGLHRIKGRLSNLYLVNTGEAGEKFYVVDSGLSADYPDIEEYLEEEEIDEVDIEFIVLTHADMDHAGGAAKLKEISGGKVALHPAEKSQLETDDNPGRVKFAADRAGLQVQNSVEVDRTIEEGDWIGPFRVFETPGHTEGSISLFYEEKGWLFTGDAVRTDRGGRIMLFSGGNMKDPDRAERSLEKLSELEFNSLFPGHGEPIMESASGELEKSLKLM